MKAAADTKKVEKKKEKRKGLGGLSSEKKKLLKQLIMQKAADDLRKQQEQAAEEKAKAIEARVPKLDVDGLDTKQLDRKVRELYDAVCRLEDEKYDWEMKLIRQNAEIAELNIKVNDIKGQFVKPMLKRVSKTEQKLAKFDSDKTKIHGFRENLKSTGQSKFTLEEKDETGGKKPEWGRDQLKHKDDDDKKGEEHEESEEEEEEDDDEE